MAITLTESAQDRVKEYLGKRGAGVGLRLGIKKTGCSGFAYVINFADEVQAEDVVFDDSGVKVVVDPEALEYIDGRSVIEPEVTGLSLERRNALAHSMPSMR